MRRSADLTRRARCGRLIPSRSDSGESRSGPGVLHVHPPRISSRTSYARVHLYYDHRGYRPRDEERSCGGDHPYPRRDQPGTHDICQRGLPRGTARKPVQRLCSGGVIVDQRVGTPRSSGCGNDPSCSRNRSGKLPHHGIAEQGTFLLSSKAVRPAPLSRVAASFPNPDRKPPGSPRSGSMTNAYRRSPSEDIPGEAEWGAAWI